MHLDLSLASRPTVVYVITPYGPFVRRKERNFAALVRERSATYQFLVLAPTPAANRRLPECSDEVRASWGDTAVDVLCDLPDELRAALNLFGYPDTLVVSTDRRVLQNFNRAWTEGSASAIPADIEAFFGIELPGLVPEG